MCPTTQVQELRPPGDKLLWAGFSALLRGQYRDTELTGWIEERLHLASDHAQRARPVVQRLPLEMAIILSTPQLKQAYPTSLFSPDPGSSIPCTACQASIFPTDVFMKEVRAPRPPGVCLECVKRAAAITLPIEAGEEQALRWSSTASTRSVDACRVMPVGDAGADVRNIAGSATGTTYVLAKAPA